MGDKYLRFGFDRVIIVEKLITVFYMEFSKNFAFEGESHDFWELVYVDRGEILCTGGERSFVLKGGEITFHKPNEFHSLRSHGQTAPNLSIMTFECNSRAMNYFKGKIFRLGTQERAMLSLLFSEALSAYQMVDKRNPLVQRLQKTENPPFGSSQMTKNLLEAFLISLHRSTDAFAKRSRYQYKINGIDIPYGVKEIIDTLAASVYKKLTVEQLARELGKSVSSVKSLFAQYRSGGIMNYYNSLKIEEAKRLIREGKHNISQIASALQFDTPQYFSICFRRYARMSPQEYKRSIL